MTDLLPVGTLRRESNCGAPISVVIPYYQRERGILQRALRSVFAQREVPCPMHVVVVDDGSPLPAAEELAGLDPPRERIVLRVATQPNAGPAAARNAALSMTPPGTRYVAFLDSDDVWTEDHIARAVHALELGYDFYFADFYQLDQQIGAFARGGKLNLADHAPLGDPASALHAFMGDVFDQIVRGNVVGTPTVVYRYQGLEDVRFHDELTAAGEDYLFWMALARRGARVAFSSRIEATCGHGVNLYSGALWASDAHLARVRDELRYRRLTRELFAVDARQQAHLDSCVDELRQSFARALLHRMRSGDRVPSRVLWRQLVTDPLSYWAVPSVAVQLVRSRNR